jgi:hypothetical protein
MMQGRINCSTRDWLHIGSWSSNLVAGMKAEYVICIANKDG